jgi:hypothetical protein
MAKRASGVEGTARKAYWREAEARRIIGAWRSSGESMQAFGRRFGFRAERLSRWVKRLEPVDQDRREAPSIPFLPVEVRVGDRAERPVAAPPIALVVGSGLRVEVPIGFDAETLQRVVQLLGEPSAW